MLARTEALDADDLASLYCRLGGRSVTLVFVDDRAFVARLVADGLPDEIAALMASFGTAARQG